MSRMPIVIVVLLIVVSPGVVIAQGASKPGVLAVVRGLVEHQVLQRGADGRAAAELVIAGVPEGVEALDIGFASRTGAAEKGGPFVTEKVMPLVQNGERVYRTPRMPTGGPYEVRMSALGAGGILRRVVVRHVMVGDLWVLAGQSNMEGCGILKRGAVEPHPLVNVFDQADRWAQATEPLHWKWEAVDRAVSGPPGPEREKRAKNARKHRWRGGGLGLPFARAMVEKTRVPIGLLPCALGGSHLDQWKPQTDWRKLGDEQRNLFGAMMRRIDAAGGKVRGVLWYQGEADALTDRAADYVPRFEAFVAAVRGECGTDRLPFYWVQLGRYHFSEHVASWSALRHAQLACEGSVLPPAGMVAALDLPLVDAIHLRTRALAEVGRRLAVLAARDLREEDKTRQGPRPVKIEARGGYPQRIVVSFDGVNGRLRAKGRLAGFSVRDAAGKDLNIVFDQFLDPDHGDRVILETQVTWRYAPFPEGAFVHYGYGTDCYVNLEDEAGLAAPAFRMPLEVPKRKVQR